MPGLMISFPRQKNRVKDFRESMIKYLEAMMESQQQVCY